MRKTFTRPTVPSRATLIVSSLAVAAVSLTGCGAADTAAREAVQQVTPWEDQLREHLESDPNVAMTDAEWGEACLALTFLDIETPEQIGALLFAFNEDGELPDADVTLEEWAAMEGESLPFTLPKDVTVREVANEAGAWMLDKCGVDY